MGSVWATECERGGYVCVVLRCFNLRVGDSFRPISMFLRMRTDCSVISGICLLFSFHMSGSDKAYDRPSFHNFTSHCLAPKLVLTN